MKIYLIISWRAAGGAVCLAPEQIVPNTMAPDAMAPNAMVPGAMADGVHHHSPDCCHLHPAAAALFKNTQ